MMKGLFGYESAFRAYTSEVIKIQYAELRPNFPANVLAKDDASGTITNADLCQIILDESTKKLASLKAGEYFRGVKIIYCAPKLLDKDHPAEAMAANLDECIKLKQQFPQLICGNVSLEFWQKFRTKMILGFDLVGPEETMAVINDYIKELLEFRAKCRVLALDIPFIFHAGETLENGGRVDGNLFDALMLNSKRIGHGFALAQHPELMKLFKEKRIALEICPIGNEILHLCPTIGGHAMHILLANNVPCTINCDNSVFYRLVSPQLGFSRTGTDS
jgi:adenosine deaminase CECR1